MTADLYVLQAAVLLSVSLSVLLFPLPPLQQINPTLHFFVSMSP